jgi:von Willebrand factor type A domain-containing protein
LTLFKSETYTHVMTNRRVFVAVLWAAAFMLAWAHTLDAQTVQRALYVSALNDAGAPVADLGPADFIVREDNAAREVLKVEPAVEPMQVAVMVDTSQGARDIISHIRTALPGFVKTLTTGDVKNEVAIIAIGERPTVFTNYTFNQAELQKGVDRIWSIQGSGAYLLDGIIEVCQGFKKREARRPVIVAILSEGPDLSNRQHDQALEPLAANGAAFHAITMGRASTSLRDETRERNLVLDEGPRESGGRREELLTSMALGGKLTQLADELMHQYKVTYAHPQSLIPPERVTVSSAKAGVTARGTLIKEEKGRP